MKLKLKGITERGAATAMAVSKHVLNMIESLTCSVCQSVFVEPVRLDCEHNFCKSCIQKFWGKQRQAVSCPECRQVLPRRSFTTSRMLVNLCEEVRQLELKLEQDRSLCEEQGGNLKEDTEREQSLCEEQGENLKEDTEREQSLCEEQGGNLKEDTEREQSLCEEQGGNLKEDTEREQSLCEEQGENLREDTEREQSLCEQHREKLILFCEVDETLICAKCVNSPPHSAHKFLPLPVAVEQYKDQLKLSLDSMKNEKKDQSELKQQQEREISELEELTGSLEQDISTQFAKIHRYLEDKEKHLIKELRRQKEDDLRPMEEKLRRIEEKLTSLEEKIFNLCADIDQQGSVSFLKELKRLKARYLDKEENEKGAEKGEDVEVEMVPKRKYIRFRGPLLYIAWKGMKQIISPVAASLTLDPKTAHPQLTLSVDRTSVKIRNGESKLLPDNPERFDTCHCVLGSQGFTSGKHYWEVEVGDKTNWDVGVARESANRKGGIKLGAGKGYWAVCLRIGNEYRATESPLVPLTPGVNPQTIGVFLDYEDGHLTFYNADDVSVLHTFTDTFTEKLFPYFWAGPDNKGKNAASLKLRHLKPFISTCPTPFRRKSSVCLGLKCTLDFLLTASSHTLADSEGGYFWSLLSEKPERGAVTAMAVSEHVLNLSEDLTCSVCQSLFVEPVRLDCEHNFCKSCIQKFWGKQRQAVSCPECQQVLPRRSFTSNKVLVNLCEKTRQLELKLEQDRSLCEEEWENLREDTEREQSLCEEHREKLILFCEVDEILICVSCLDSSSHSAHKFLHLQMAVEHYKEQLKSSLDSMENEKKNQSELKQQQKIKISELEELTGSLEKGISAQFNKIHQYLHYKEKCLIEELKRQKEEDLRPMEENLRRIEEELASLEEKIANLCVDIDQQDSVSFLKELKRLKERYLDKEENEKGAERGEDVEIEIVPRRKYTRFRGPLLYIVWKGMKQIISPVPASLTLDPNTAHRNLVLSEDRTSMKFGFRALQVPDNPERFDKCQCVLCSQSFTAGKHYWEVEVGRKNQWLVGVVSESANRKGSIRPCSKHGYWLLSLQVENQYVATESPSVSLTLSVNPRKIGIFLDYEEGQVSFYNADDMSVLHTFTDSFTEKLFPFFYPGSLNEGKNAAPLKLLHFVL
ncbi:uncharacterized protein [Scyliorhinus torazame]|uniref:uncharacterized protein n=1 Tax=Scyliorhinus torazame TaxID=75743 RepID=UPI003B58F265